MEKQQSVMITLNKFNGQSGQYYTLLVFEVTKEQFTEAQIKAQFRAHVEGYYRYDYTLDSRPYNIYSVTPALFDHLETTVT